MSTLNVTNAQEGPAAVLKLEGRLDTNTSPAFNDRLMAALDSEKELVLDMNGLVYVSSAGLRVILAAQKKATAGGAVLRLRGVQPAVRDVLDMTGFLEFLTLED